jgi:hypothetical protein
MNFAAVLAAFEANKVYRDAVDSLSGVAETGTCVFVTVAAARRSSGRRRPVLSAGYLGIPIP